MPKSKIQIELAKPCGFYVRVILLEIFQFINKKNTSNLFEVFNLNNDYQLHTPLSAKKTVPLAAKNPGESSMACAER